MRLLLRHKMSNLITLFQVLVFYTLTTSHTYNRHYASIKLEDNLIQSKKTPDSLQNKTYKELENRFNANRSDSLLVTTYSYAYLRKAKKESNTFEIANGYHMLCQITIGDLDTSVKYADSIIDLTKNKRYKKYPTRGYLFKGLICFSKHQYSKALDSYLLALRSAELDDDAENIIALKHNIALLRHTLGEDRKALETYLDNLKFIKTQDTLVKFRPHYVTTLFKISSTFNDLKNVDSGLIYIKKTIKTSLAKKPQYYYKEALINYGINSYLRKDYQSAIDSLTKAEKLLGPNSIYASKVKSYLWLGKSNMALNRESKAFVYFKKVDSMSEMSNYSASIRDAYTTLIDHYKKIDDKDNQLRLMQKLIQYDSVTNKNNKRLNVDIVRNYDTAQLIKEKDLLIKDVQNQNQKTKYNSFLIGVLSIFMITLFYYFFYKRKRLQDQKGFNKRLENIKNKKIKKGKELEIDTKVTNNIIQKLEKFEKSEAFLDSNLTMAKVAKSFKTNSTYLSKIINTHKKKNFAKYLNDLRIEYAIKKIKTDRKFRLYAIKSIAKDVGFNSVQSFSNAFYKKTGKYPSEFIREID